MLITCLGAGGVFTFDTPTDDRWHYPFNGTPGFRALASSFAAHFEFFNDRDGEIVFAWNTDGQIPPGQGASNYPVRSVRIIMTNTSEAAWPVDLTPDPWYTVDLNYDGTINADGIPRGETGDTDGESDDPDPGRPFEIYGAGFGPTYTLQTWDEFSFYEGSDSTQDLPRDPYPMTFQEGTLEVLHVEDHVKGLWNDQLDNPVFQFTPQPWSIGVPIDYTPGSQTVPFDIVFDVDLTLFDGAVRAYFQDQLNEGRIALVACSLHEAVQQGGTTELPNVFTKEGAGIDPDAHPAMLEITLGFDLGDMNCDGDINTLDIEPFVLALTNPAQYAIDFPDCDANNADVNQDGAVNSLDIEAFIDLLLGP
jgi:hypothetical protein